MEDTPTDPKEAPERWVNCPVCGEPDMRRTEDQDGNALIFCVNHACLSSGGKNNAAIAERADRLQAELGQSLTDRKNLMETVRYEAEQRTRLTAELDAAKDWRNEAEKSLVQAGRGIADLIAELDALRIKHEVACQTITTMQDERRHRDSYAVLASLSSYLGMGGGDASAKVYEERIRQGIEHVTSVQTERADRLQAEVERLTIGRDDLVDHVTKVRAELDAVRKERDEAVQVLVNRLCKSSRDCDAAQAKCAELEKLIQDAPHEAGCHAGLYVGPRAIRLTCTCWKSRLTPAPPEEKRP